jgi:hypothetical protein
MDMYKNLSGIRVGLRNVKNAHMHLRKVEQATKDLKKLEETIQSIENDIYSRVEKWATHAHENLPREEELSSYSANSSLQAQIDDSAMSEFLNFVEENMYDYSSEN